MSNVNPIALSIIFVGLMYLSVAAIAVACFLSMGKING